MPPPIPGEPLAWLSVTEEAVSVSEEVAPLKAPPPRAAPPPSPLRPFHESHAAFSTIHPTRASKEIPACRAMSGTSEVGVIPGWVFNSSR